MRTDWSFHGSVSLAPHSAACVDAPSARRMGTDSSHAESCFMRARFSGHVPKGQKFIAQGKRSDTLGYGGRWAFSPHSLTYNTAPLTRANYFPYLLTRLLSHEPAPFLPDLPTCPSNALSTLYIPHSTIPLQHPSSLAQQFPFNTQHSSFNIQPPTFHIIKCWG